MRFLSMLASAAIVMLGCVFAPASSVYANTVTVCSPSPISASPIQVDGSYQETLNSPGLITGGACSPAPQPVNCAAPVIASSTAGIAHFSRWPDPQRVYLDSGLGPFKSANVSSFDALFGPWPGRFGFIAYVMLPTNNYLAMQFKVPAGYMPTSRVLYGGYRSGETGNKANYSITISACPGDFSNPTKAGSTVVAGCWKNRLGTSGLLQWNSAGASCVLHNGQTYYLNFINADISQVQPNGGGTAASTRTAGCTNGTCELPIYNGPGNWSGYQP